jgi:anti-sigma factor RsiW
MDGYLNEGLPLYERGPFEIHLSDCRACQHHMENHRRLLAALQSESSPPVPEGFVGRVMARAEEREAIDHQMVLVSSEASPSMWKRIGGSPAGIAAALAAGLLVGVFMGGEAWQAHLRQEIPTAARPADPLVASGFHQLVDPGGGSLTLAYLQLTATSDR